MRIFCSNMEWNASEAEIKALFSEYGMVDNVRLIFHEGTPPRRRGFVFVEMDSEGEALKAIISLDGKTFKGRTIHCEKALSKEEFLAKRNRDYLLRNRERENGQSEDRGSDTV